MAHINIKNMEGLEKGLRKSPATMIKHLQRGIARSGAKLDSMMKIETPVDTGALRGSVHFELGKLETEVAPNKKYAKFVEYGTRRQRANPFIQRTVKKGTPKVEAIIDKSIKDALDVIFK